MHCSRDFAFFQWSLLASAITFMVFKGPMIFFAVAALTVFHPGRVFGDLWVSAGKGARSMGKLWKDKANLIQLTEH